MFSTKVPHCCRVHRYICYLLFSVCPPSQSTPLWSTTENLVYLVHKFLSCNCFHESVCGRYTDLACKCTTSCQEDVMYLCLRTALASGSSFQVVPLFCSIFLRRRTVMFFSQEVSPAVVTVTKIFTSLSVDATLLLCCITTKHNINSRKRYETNTSSPLRSVVLFFSLFH
jgi:hypothetical protein